MGKDRTGYSIMLIEAILGVDEKLMVDDYMLTKRARHEKNKEYKNRFFSLANGNQDIADYLYIHFDTHESFIKSAQDEILKNYETIVEYIEKELHIDRKTQENIKDKYLE